MIDQKRLDEIRARVTSAASDYMIMSLVFGDTRDLLDEVERLRMELENQALDFQDRLRRARGTD